MVYMIESQIAYVMDALREMNERGADVVEVRPEVEARFHAEVQRRMQGTVWNTGCTSWYQDAQGQQPDAVAGLDVALPARTARFNPQEYVVA